MIENIIKASDRFGRKAGSILFNIKKSYAGVFALICCMAMLISPEMSLKAASGGLDLWWKHVIPSLLPFFVFTDLLMYAGVHKAAGKIFRRPLSFILGVRGEAAFVFVSSILSGYPAGAAVIGKMCREGVIRSEEGERILTFCSTSGPVFIVGAVGAGMLDSASAGYVILVSHCLSAVITGIIMNPESVINRKNSFSGKISDKRYSAGYSEKYIYDESRNFTDILTDAVYRSLKTVGLIGGYIVIFSVLSQYMIKAGEMITNENASMLMNIFSRLFEITVGCGRICASAETGADIQTVTACSALISFGGFSVAAQTAGVLKGSGIKMRTYFTAKIIHAVLSAALTVVIMLSAELR